MNWLESLAVILMLFLVGGGTAVFVETIGKPANDKWVAAGMVGGGLVCGATLFWIANRI